MLSEKSLGMGIQASRVKKNVCSRITLPIVKSSPGRPGLRRNSAIRRRISWRDGTPFIGPNVSQASETGNNDDVAKNPPLGVRSTIRARRYYLEQLSREVLMQVNLAKLHLTEDFAESARAFAEKRSPRPYKGR